MESPKRKSNRLADYDYSRNGTYFITFCVQNRLPILSRIPVGASIARPSVPELSATGKTVEDVIQKIPVHDPNITVDHYVIMPNHVHLLLCLNRDAGWEDNGQASDFVI